jgi:MFS family permease
MCWLFLVSITSLSDILLPFFWNTDKFDPNPRYRQWIAHGGLQINFINFTSVMGWSMGQSGGALAMMGLLVAAVPKLVLPLLGVRASIFIGLLVYSISQMLLGSAFLLKTAAQRTMAVYAGIALVSLGTVSLPAILSLLVSQVAADEQGAVQGLADTTKVLTTMLATPFMAAFFGKCIGLEDSLARGGSFFLGAGLSGVACIIAVLTFGAESLFSREHEVAKRSKK